VQIVGNSTAFNYKLADAQATAVDPVAPADFPFEAYSQYEAELRQRCREFQEAATGVLVYRRMRVGECFSYGCRNMEDSLRWQLGALAASVQYPADVANFLEPWYGIGVVAGAFGAEYAWEPGQAPALRPRFQSSAEALASAPRPVAETPIGRHTLAMIDYFLQETGGRLPMSLCDVQSPLSIACNLVNTGRFCTDLVDGPDEATELLARASRLLVEFTRAQLRRIGPAIVWPGHGFASCRDFQGLGISEDNVLILSNAMYGQYVAPSFEAAGAPFAGVAFHSCGNWSGKIPVVRELAGLRMIDGAFSPATDPKPNPPEPFRDAALQSGVVLNARIVGDVNTIAETVKRLWAPGMKLIVVTYCPTPAEQAEAYARIHEICR
jgi:hypothetical protein